MQTAFAATRAPAAFKAGKPAASARRSALVVRAHRDGDFVQTLGKQAAVAAAALALTLSPPAQAAVAPKLTAFQKEQAYQAEMMASIKARSGKETVLGSLTASPTDAVKVETKVAPLKFDGGFEKVTIETPAATPTPAPAVPAAVAPPKAAPAPAPAAASYKAAAPAAAAPAAASDSGDNKGLLIGGGVAVLAVAGVAAAGNNGEAAPAVAGVAPVAAAGSDVPPNVAEARAWIAAWKKKHGKA